MSPHLPPLLLLLHKQEGHGGRSRSPRSRWAAYDLGAAWYFCRVSTSCIACQTRVTNYVLTAPKFVLSIKQNTHLRVWGLLLCWYSCLLCFELLILSFFSSPSSSPVLCGWRSKLTTCTLPSPSPGSKLLYPKVVSGLHRVTNSALRSSTTLPLFLLRFFFLEESGLAVMWNAEDGEEATNAIWFCLDGWMVTCTSGAK